MKYRNSSINRPGLPRRLGILVVSLVLFMIFIMIISWLWLRTEVSLTEPIYFNITTINPTYNSGHVRDNNTINESEKIQSVLETLVEKVESIAKAMTYLSLYQKHLDFRNQILNLLPSKNQISKSDSFHPYIVLDSVERNCSSTHKLVILVSSNAPNIARRRLIRKYWGNYSHWTTNFQWKVIFVTGGNLDKNILQELQEEGKTYKDVLMEDIEESFYNLSFKVMVGLTWLNKNLKYEFLLKCDDDVFVNVDSIMKVLSTTNDHFFGQALLNQPVERKGRYGVSKEEHFGDHYDPYCSGGGYILSSLTVSKIIPHFNWETPLKIDDAYIGQLVKKAGTETVHYEGFYMWNQHCQFKKELLVSHPVKHLRCMEFLMNKSLILNEKLKNDTLDEMDYAFTEEERKKM